jgi:hypothetical protein
MKIVSETAGLVPVVRAEAARPVATCSESDREGRSIRRRLADRSGPDHGKEHPARIVNPSAFLPMANGPLVNPERFAAPARDRKMKTVAVRRGCPGPINRRAWLRIGGLHLGALAVGLQPSLGGLLAAEAGRAQPGADREFSVILFWAKGGPSHVDLFDLKPQAPAEIRGPFKPIATNVPGLEITELLPKLARMADKFALVRSLHHERNEHSGGTHRFLTGYSSRAANLNDAEFPEIPFRHRHRAALS